MPQLSRSFTYRHRSHVGALQPPARWTGFGLFRFRSPLLTESILFLFLRLLRCFTSAGLACSSLFDSGRDDPVLTGPGYPIRKSPDQSLFCSSPRLIAAYHVLHRLSAPRHPLCALSSLIPVRNQQFPIPRERDRQNCRKNKMGNRVFQGLQDRLQLQLIYAVRKNFSPCGCQRAVRPPRIVGGGGGVPFAARRAANGGPGWT
jgi:hypothetical protein